MLTLCLRKTYRVMEMSDPLFFIIIYLYIQDFFQQGKDLYFKKL